MTIRVRVRNFQRTVLFCCGVTSVAGCAGAEFESDAPASGGNAGASASGGSAGVLASGGNASAGASGGSAGASASGGNAGARAPDGNAGAGVGLGGAVNAEAVTLRLALTHRYSFNGSGTVATDSIGTAHGTIVNTALNGTGVLTLAGMTSDQYVDLPNGILAGLGDATFEAWLTWSGGDMWQRIFDFGSTSDGTPAMGTSYLFLTPRGANPTVRATFSANGRNAEVAVDSSAALPTMTPSHLTLVVCDSLDTLTLYVDGVSVSSVPFAGHLSEVSDINNWLGRSQFSADPEFGGTLTEFRIYRTALSAKQIQLSHSSGPDAILQ